MDKIYRPEKFSCSEPINLKEYFENFSKLFSNSSGSTIENLEIKTKREFEDYVDVEDLTQIETSIDLLDKVEDTPSENVPEKRPLQCTKTRNSRPMKTDLPKIENYANCEQNDIKKIKSDNVPPSEFAISVRIYHPVEFSFTSDKPNGYQNIKFSHEIVALGSNTLAQLRDKIMCFNDKGACYEVTNPFDAPQSRPDPKTSYPSGFIFIDNVFYNDFRHPDSIDYSQVIVEWAKQKQIQPLSVFTMETTKIDELTPRFGYPYLYMHQGKCEHLLVFTDAWLVINQSINYAEYPRYQGVHRFRCKQCVLCTITLAQWMVIDCNRLPHDKSFLCSECMFSYLYIDGQKIGDFKVYHLYDKNDIL